jgi:hypothetical protein
MEIGDIVSFDGKPSRIRGFDPIGVEPRFVYLEDTKTGRTASITFEDTMTSPGHGLPRLGDGNSQEER